MGIIKITPRSSSLQSGHSVGAGNVHVPHMPTNINTGEVQKWRGFGSLGQGIAEFGEKMLKAAGILAEIRNETQLDEFESDFLNRLHEANMNPETGFMTRRIGSTADVETLAKEGPKAYKEIFDEVSEAHGMTGVRRNWAMNRVGRMMEGASLRLANRVSSAYSQLNLSKAAENVEARHVAWRDGMDDQNATSELLDAGRKLLYAQGLDDAAVDVKFGEQVENLAEEYATGRFAGLPNEAAVDAEVEKLEKDPSQILAGNTVLADQFTAQHPFSQDVANRLRGALERRRREIQLRDQRIVEQAANVGLSAVAQIRNKDGNYPENRLATVEASITSLQKIQGTLPKESDAAARAAAHISKLDKDADMIAQQEIIDEYLSELKTNPKAKIYIPEKKNEKGEVLNERNTYAGAGRKERLAPMVQQMVDQQRQSGSDAQSRMANIANWKLKMLNGAKNPGEYHNEIFKAAEKGDLTLNEYETLKSEFDSSWAQGFMPGKKSPKQLAAEGMLGVIQEFFPNEELAASYEWDSKTGGLKMKKGAKYAGLEYKAVDRGRYANLAWRFVSGGFDLPASPRKMGPDQVEKIVNVATALSFYDGQQLDFDPITGKDVDFFTGEKIKTGKDAPKFNAVNYFKQYLGRLKDEKKAIDASEYVMQLVEADKNLSNAFADLDANRTKIITSAQESKTRSVIIRNRKSGEGIAPVN